jgi:AraC family transcriptional regulator
MHRRPLPGPDGLFNVSRQPRFVADSSVVGWDGAFFTDIVAAQEGTVDHGHSRFCLTHSSVPFLVRDVRRSPQWTTVKPGVYLSHPGDEQRFDWQGGGSRKFLFVEPSRVEQIWETPTNRHQRHPNEAITSPLAETLLRALVSDLQEGSPAGALVGDSLIVALLAHLHGHAQDTYKGSGRLAPVVCQRVLAYMDERMADPLSLTELAELARMSVRHFCRAFHASTGYSPHQYLLHQRVERAKSLLVKGRMPISEIAQSMGFADQSQFSRTFRRLSGITPAAYRMNH